MSYKIIIGYFTLIIGFSCQNEPNTPKFVTQNFEEKINLGKVEDAKKYCTESTGKIIDRATSLGKMQPDPNFKFIFIRDSISNNNAWVWYKNDKGEISREKVIKIENKWLVKERQDLESIYEYRDSKNQKQVIKTKLNPY